MHHETSKYWRDSLPLWSVPFIRSIAEHDLTTHLHSVRVATVTSSLWPIVRASAIYGPTPVVTTGDMFLSSMLHDNDKTNVPPATLAKHGGLTDEEMQLLAQHPFRGAAAVAPYSVKLADIIRGHHRFGRNGVIYPPYEDDPDAQEAMKRPGYPEIELAQLVLALADKADVGINRVHGVHGFSFEHEQAELQERFKAELESGRMFPEWIDGALRLAWEAGGLTAFFSVR